MEANYATWLYAILKANINIQTLIGTRIYPNLIPEESIFPAISYRLISQEIDNVKGAKKKVNRFNFQLNLFGISYGDLKLIESIVQETLLGDTTVVFISESGTYTGTYLKNTTEGEYDEEKKVYHLINDYEMRIV